VGLNYTMSHAEKEKTKVALQESRVVSGTK
jgi:hypothetical protein